MEFRWSWSYGKYMGFIGWIIMGLAAGAVARGILKQKGSWVSCLVLGVAGGVVGGWLGAALFDKGSLTFFSLSSWILAIGGSVLVLWLWTLITNKK